MAVTPQLIKELREITSAGMMDCKKALESTNGNIEEAIVWLRENGLAKAAKKADRVAAEGVSFAAESDKAAVIFEVNSETDFVSKNEKFMSLINDISIALLNSQPKDLKSALASKLKDGNTIEQACVSATATIGEKIELRRVELIAKDSKTKVALYNHANKRISVLLSYNGDMSKEDAYNVCMHVAAMAPKYLTIDEIPQSFRDSELHIIRENSDLEGKNPEMIENILKGKLNKKLSEFALLEQGFVMDDKKTVGAFLKANKSSVTKMIRFEVGEGIEKVTTDFAAEVAAQLK